MKIKAMAVFCVSLIRTILIFAMTILFLVIFTPLVILAFLLGIMGLKKPMTWMAYRFAQLWAIAAISISGCKISVEGRENIPMKGGVCFVSNHVGIFDIVLAIAYIGRPFGFIAKRELLFLPAVNIWVYILGGLFIDRRNIRKAVSTINKGIKKLQKGSNMLIFPEGTRSKGRGLLPFRSGAIKLATNSLAPIVPVAISGSYEVFEKHRMVNAVPVRMVFCPLVITAGMSSEDRKGKLVDQISSTIGEFIV